MLIISLLSLILFLSFGIALYINFHPQFGQAPSKEKQQSFRKSAHFENGQFKNKSASPMNIKFFENLKEFLKKVPERQPAKAIKPKTVELAHLSQLADSSCQLIWFGHSTFLMQMDGLNILLDPMFSEVPAPHPWLGLGVKRYSAELPLKVSALPKIDAVIYSHDHYDHLDYESVRLLKAKVDRFFVPLGLGSHLALWGVETEKIQELDWWDEAHFKGIEFICTPARHFSGRALFDRAATLWSSWVIKGNKYKVYFGGDSGYDTHFKEIGQQYGPFDLALLECGQYNQDWKYIHMMPEETAQAAIDLKAALAMPIHWGAFTLAFHPWQEPVERMLKKAEELDLKVTTPQIGEPLKLGVNTYPQSKWWKNYLAQ